MPVDPQYAHLESSVALPGDGMLDIDLDGVVLVSAGTILDPDGTLVLVVGTLRHPALGDWPVGLLQPVGQRADHAGGLAAHWFEQQTALRYTSSAGRKALLHPQDRGVAAGLPFDD